MAVLKVLKTLKSLEHKVIFKIGLWLKNGCLKMNLYASDLLNLLVETMNLIVEDISPSHTYRFIVSGIHY